jgi:hypothetical protein
MEPGGVWSVLWIVVPGFFAGLLLADSVRRIFTDDATLLKRIFLDQPVTMSAAATAIGSVLVWGVLRILGVM